MIFSLAGASAYPFFTPRAMAVLVHLYDANTQKSPLGQALGGVLFFPTLFILYSYLQAATVDKFMNGASAVASLATLI